MPPSDPSLADWLARLETFSPHEIELGLGRVQEVLERLQIARPAHVLHVAGTNGKGSSVAMAEALLAGVGTVGCYTSPHVLQFNERIRTNGTSASDADIVAAFEHLESVRGDIPLTYFEFGTIAALAVFEAHGVDIAILEVGMGGRLDAVNAIEPTAGLITNVSLDHCDWLGEDIETIAMEKAGIMRAGKPVVFASPNPPQAILRHAEKVGAELIVAKRDYHWDVEEDHWRWHGRMHEIDGLAPPSLRGATQIGNAAGVLALLESASIGAWPDAEAVNSAFSSLSLDGRMQSVRSDRYWLLDVAHNPAAATVLAGTLSESGFEGRTVAIVAMLDDKDVEGVVAPLAGMVDAWVAVTAESGRAIAAEELARRVANATNRACLEAESLQQAMEHVRSVTGSDDRILVTGSFYLVGPVLQALGIYSAR